MQHPRMVPLDDAFERLYQEQADRLWRAVFAFSSDREVASDAVAEAFAQSLRGGDAIRDPAAWVWRVAFRLAAGELQRRRRSSGTITDRPAIDVVPDDPDILAAVATLPEKQRAAILLHYYADLSQKETARIIGSSATAVGVHLYRGRKRLRELLGDDHDDA